MVVCIPNKHITLFVMMIGEILIGTMNLLGTINGATIVSIMTGKAKMWALALATLIGYMNYFGICETTFVIVTASIVIIMQIIVIFEYGSKVRKVKEIKNEKIKMKKGKDLLYALFNTEYYLENLDKSILEKLSV